MQKHYMVEFLYAPEDPPRALIGKSMDVIGPITARSPGAALLEVLEDMVSVYEQFSFSSHLIYEADPEDVEEMKREQDIPY